MFKRRPKPDYKHIRELEVETGLADPEPDAKRKGRSYFQPAPGEALAEMNRRGILGSGVAKRDLVPVDEHALRTLSAKLDPKTGGLILDKKPMAAYVNTFPASAACLSASFSPGAVWPVDDRTDVRAFTTEARIMLLHEARMLNG